MTGGISQRALRSTFASSLPMALIKTMQEKRTNKFHTPTFEYSQTLSYPAKNQNNEFNFFNRFYPEKDLLYNGSSSSISFSSYGEGQGWMSSPTTSSSSFLTRDLNSIDMNLVNKV